MNMNNEPIRLPAWLASLLAIVILPALSSLLLGTDWRTVLVGVIAAVIPLIAYTESKRARTDSPATIQSRLEELAAVPLPEDERDGCDGHEG